MISTQQSCSSCSSHGPIKLHTPIPARYSIPSSQHLPCLTHVISNISCKNKQDTKLLPVLLPRQGPPIQITHPSIQVRRIPQPPQIRRHQPERRAVPIPPIRHQSPHIANKQSHITQSGSRASQAKEQRCPEEVQCQLCCVQGLGGAVGFLDGWEEGL